MRKIALILTLSFLASSYLHAQKDKFTPGSKVPPFVIRTYTGDRLDMEEILETKDRLIIIFYQGSWSEYDRKYLKAIQERYEEIQQKNAEVVVITREKAAYVKKLVEEEGLTFPICMDNDWYVMSSYQVAYKMSARNLPDKYKEYSGYNYRHTGSKDDIVPIPATYIVDQKRKVIWNYFEHDFRRRPKVEDVMNNL
ncbi:redoxin domain-containing protein [bacterium SCSIO 12741]|nr:redoxin domain-containing protein [bacterium SCSIO 12741]